MITVKCDCPICTMPPRRGLFPRGTLLAIESPGFSLVGTLLHDTDDLDGSFVVKDVDNGDVIRINGWSCGVEIVDQLGVDRD